MDTTLLDEVEVRESRPEDERTLVKEKTLSLPPVLKAGLKVL